MIIITRLISLDLLPSIMISRMLCWLSLSISAIRVSSSPIESEPLLQSSSVTLAISTTARECSAICVEEAESSSIVEVISATEDEVSTLVEAWPSTASVIFKAAS
ncbi:hypothetical protein D3C75_647270 [compost metagenome]